jgi:uncharacterized membrane protein
MDRNKALAQTAFAIGMIGLGVLGFVYGDFAMVWQTVPAWVPARTEIAYTAAALMLLGGIGLLVERTAALSARILFCYLALWVLLLKVPVVTKAPLVEGNWSGMAEIVVLLAGGWVLFATLNAARDGAPPNVATGKRGVWLAQILFGLALPPLGLAHIVYLDQTAPLIPAWLPYHTALAYGTGAAHIAAGFAVLLSIVPRLAATLEAVMLTAFTMLVWIPAVVAAPTARLSWTATAISWAISGGAWVVASSIERKVAQ